MAVIGPAMNVLLRMLASWLLSGLAGIAVAAVPTESTLPPAPARPLERAGTALVYTLAQVGEGTAALTTQVSLPEDGGERVLLVRAVGPGLAGFGIETPLALPRVAVFRTDGSRVNGSEYIPPDAEKLEEAARAAGTFPLARESRDAALLVALGPGRYTVQVTSAGAATGTALLEVYDVTATQAESTTAAATAPDGRPDFTSRAVDGRELLVHFPFTNGLEALVGDGSGIRIHGIQLRAGAAWFDGRTSEIVIPRVSLDRRAFAVAMWIRLEDAFPGIGLLHQPVGHRRSQHLHLVLRNSTPRLGFYLDDLSTDNAVTPKDGWAHLVFQYTGAAQEVWLNGARIGLRAARPYLGAAGDLHLGKAPRWSNVPAHDFKGGMRDFRLYERALTVAEVKELARR